jgi:hypothetical protein
VLIAESDRFLTFQREGIEMLYMLEGGKRCIGPENCFFAAFKEARMFRQP